MALSYLPDSRERVRRYLVSDPSIQAVNTVAAMAAYAEGKSDDINAPEDATVVEIVALSSPGLAWVRRHSPDFPANLRGLDRDYTPEEAEQAGDYFAAVNRAAAIAGVRSISDWPEVVASAAHGVHLYPAELIDRLPDTAVSEIGRAVMRLAQFDPVGKARSGSRPGAATTAPGPGAARTAGRDLKQRRTKKKRPR